MKILVTGGAGFIGSHTCDRLVENEDVVERLDPVRTLPGPDDLVGRVELDDTDRDGQTLLVSDPEAMAMAEIPIGTSSFTAQGWEVFSIRRAPEPWTVSRFTRRNSIRSSSTLSGSRLFTHSLAKPVGATGLNPSCRRAWLAFVSLRPVVLNLGVQALASLLHLRTFFVPIYQIRAEQIEFVIQSDELTH